MLPFKGRKLVFMPGLDGTGISFEPLAPLLPSDVDVQIVRYPADRFLTFDETLACAEEQITVDGDTIILAESFSGPVAAALVGSGHLRPGCLILCATFARSPRPVLLKAILHLPLAGLLTLPLPRFLFSLMVEGGAASARVFLDLWTRVKMTVPPRMLVHRLRLVSEVDVRRRLPGLDMPCCYIQATHDRTVPSSCLQDFMVVPHLTVKKIRGPHFILQAQPGACLSAIEEFLEHAMR
jgi:pimeloyl-ACP methyl ester carboxylesterase